MRTVWRNHEFPEETAGPGIGRRARCAHTSRDAGDARLPHVTQLSLGGRGSVRQAAAVMHSPVLSVDTLDLRTRGTVAECALLADAREAEVQVQRREPDRDALRHRPSARRADVAGGEVQVERREPGRNTEGDREGISRVDAPEVETRP